MMILLKSITFDQIDRYTYMCNRFQNLMHMNLRWFHPLKYILPLLKINDIIN